MNSFESMSTTRIQPEPVAQSCCVAIELWILFSLCTVFVVVFSKLKNRLIILRLPIWTLIRYWNKHVCRFILCMLNVTPSSRDFSVRRAGSSSNRFCSYSFVSVLLFCYCAIVLLLLFVSFEHWGLGVPRCSHRSRCSPRGKIPIRSSRGGSYS